MAHILVVEDEPDVREVGVEALEAGGYDVAATGESRPSCCSKMLSGTGGHFPPVICDIHLPSLSGLSVCDYVRLDPRLSAVPFLFLSGLG